MAHHLGISRALLVGRDRADERFVLGCEDVRRGPEDLRRAAAEEDVLRLYAEPLRYRVGEIARGS
jgi:hypothetical protein